MEFNGVEKLSLQLRDYIFQWNREQLTLPLGDYTFLFNRVQQLGLQSRDYTLKESYPIFKEWFLKIVIYNVFLV